MTKGIKLSACTSATVRAIPNVKAVMAIELRIAITPKSITAKACDMNFTKKHSP
jgi:hypothetical protein